MKLVLLLAASISLFASTISTGMGSTSRPKTSVHLYAPFSGGGLANGIRVQRSARGYCWTSSGADARPDAWRCFVGNYIYDPCFSDGVSGANYVVCPLYTPLSKVLRINLTRKLPRSTGAKANPTRFPPWTVQTASGKWCTILTGATGEIAGMRINYGCTGGGYLLGVPSRSSPRWKIFFAKRYKSSQLTSIYLAAAWW
jgi:hypothetical protein